MEEWESILRIKVLETLCVNKCTPLEWMQKNVSYEDVKFCDNVRRYFGGTGIFQLAKDQGISVNSSAFVPMTQLEGGSMIFQFPICVPTCDETIFMIPNIATMIIKVMAYFCIGYARTTFRWKMEDMKKTEKNLEFHLVFYN